MSVFLEEFCIEASTKSFHDDTLDLAKSFPKAISKFLFMYRNLLIQLKWLQNSEKLRQGDFNPFGPKEPTPGRRKRKPPRFEFLGAIGLLLGIFGVLGFLIFQAVLFISYIAV